MDIDASWTLLSGRAPDAAIAVLELRGDVDTALAALGVAPVKEGAFGLRDIGGIDHGVVARTGPHEALLMPHAGPAVLDALLARLQSLGIARRAPERWEDLPMPERAERALARAASPIAVDLLCDQPRRWESVGPDAAQDTAVLARSRLLNRLLDPPTVVALGRPNIGKSTLLNALARRAVAITADEPGTTRDHVGVMLELDGLVVRYLDTPGLLVAQSDPILARAQSLALEAARRADLLLLCADPSHDFVDATAHLGDAAPPVLRVSLRADLGPARAAAADLAVCAIDGSNLAELAKRIRAALVPDEAIDDPGPWKFWER